MKISNILLSAAIVLSATCGFSASVTKKNYDELSGNDDIVVDVDLSGISGGADTNAVNDLIGEYDRTNLTGRIDRKRDKTDLKVYRKVKDCWTWTNWNNPEEPLAREAPDDFLALANSPCSDPIFFRNGAWWGAVQFWPNGKVKYSQSDIPPAGTGEFSTRLNFAMFAYDETGTNELFRFGATARRTDPTNETVVCWDESAGNQYVRIATTDLVDGTVSRSVEASTNGLASVAYVDSATNGIRNVDGTARQLPPYLHYIHFDDSYPDDAEWYYDKIDHIGYCSCRRIGSFFERNYDWTFDESATFVGTMSRGVNQDGTTRYASVFVSSAGTNLSEQVVKSGKWSRCYKALPGMCLDGINENGLFANINVVVTNGAPWETKGDRDLNMLGCIRYVLDHFMRAEDAAKYVAEHAYIPNSMKRLGDSLHMVVGDENETWLVEDGIAYLRPDGVPSIMTNFRLAVSDDPYGTGYERFEILSDESNSITNAWYTNAYKPVDGIFPWPTEFAAPGLATHTQTNFLQQWAQQVIIPALPPKRNGKWWQTVHTSIYDISKQTLRVAVQEKDDWYSFSVQKSGKVQSVNGKTGDVSLDADDVGALPRNDDYYWLEADDTGFWFDGWGPDSGAGLYADGGEGCVYVYDADGGVDLMTTKIRANGVTLSYPTNSSESGTILTDGNVGDHALKNDENWLRQNENFSNAVAAKIPDKFALSNITNAGGNAVSAVDVGAMPIDEDGIVDLEDVGYLQFKFGRNTRFDFAPDTATIGIVLNSQNFMYFNHNGFSVKNNGGSSIFRSWSQLLTPGDVRSHLDSSVYPINSDAVREALEYYLPTVYIESDYLKKNEAQTTYLTKNDAQTTYAQKTYVDGATNDITEIANHEKTKFVTGNAEVWHICEGVTHWKIVSLGNADMSPVSENKWYCQQYNLYLFWVASQSHWYMSPADDWSYGQPSNENKFDVDTITFDAPIGTLTKEVIGGSKEKLGDIALTSNLSSYVPASRKINGQPLTNDITIGGKYAMFIIPMNETSYSSGTEHFTQFELKASTNNFSASASQQDRCCFYSHSGHADGFFSTNDKMRLYLNHGGTDQRSYVRISNTLDGMPDYAPSEVIVIVDAAMMNPDRSDGSWLHERNEDVVWTWVRTKDGEREFDADTDHCLWRPIVPLRWFSKLPSWAE